LLGVLAIPLGFVLARQLGFHRFVGLLLGLLLATSPYLVWYGQEAKMYALLLALITLAFIAYLKALQGDRWPSPLTEKRPRWGWWIVFVGATSLSYYIHILSPLMLLVYGVVAWVYASQLRQHWRGWLISMTILTLPYIPLAIWQIPLLLKDFHSGHPFYPLREEIYLLLQLYSRGLVRFVPVDWLALAPGSSSQLVQQSVEYFRRPFWDLIPLIIFVFLFLCGLFLKPNKEREVNTASRFILAAWSLLPPLVVYLISLRVPVFEDRYLIYIMPAFYLLIALGLMLVGQHWRWLAGFCLGLILIFNLTGIWQQQRQPIKADFRAAAAYLSGQPHPPATIMIQIPYLQHTFNYYYQADYVLLEGLWTNNDKTKSAVDAEMITRTANLTELWLVVSEEDLWDKRHLTRTWLDEHAELVDEGHFMRVDVYHYQFQPGFIQRQSWGGFND
jgi:uncharacterized membrane protein